MIIPYTVDVPFDRRPLANWAIIAVAILAFLAQTASERKHKALVELTVERMVESDPNIRIVEAKEIAETKFKDAVDPYRLKDFSPSGLFGHIWLHGDIFHILGNMIFLWVFGNAVCSKLGGFIYFPIYIALGLIAGACAIKMGEVPAIGASGAIMGVVGMYLVMFPLNEISCLTFVYWRPYTFSCSSYWMVLYWFAWNIIGLFIGDEGIGYVAHISGFLGGIIIAVTMLLTKLVTMGEDERSLLEIFKIQKRPPREFDKQGRTVLQEKTQEYIPAGVTLAAPRQQPAAAEPAPDIDFDFNAAPVDFGNIDISNQPLEAPPAPAGVKASTPAPPNAAPVTPPPGPKIVPPARGKPDTGDFIRFACTCGHKYKVPLTSAGKKARCPKCQLVITVPKPQPITRIEDLKL